LGFSAVGITDPAPPPHADALRRWLDQGRAGTMRYMYRQAARRKNPRLVMDGVQSIVVVLYNYMSVDPPSVPGTGKIARYARGQDYHRALVPALDALRQYVEELGGPGARARSFVDAGPVPERELAQRAGLGWIGKNTMLIRPGLGSFTFIASVFTTLELTPDVPFIADRCGSCTRCLEACPTGAFPAERVLDARRCISYLTIEFRGDIPRETASLMGTWIFGCDVCQVACPWNHKLARPPAAPLVPMEPARAWVPFNAFAALDESGFDAQYGWTPLERAGLNGMRRNSTIAARNAGESTDDGPEPVP
jgi:epoxyqueuosine reductase